MLEFRLSEPNDLEEIQRLNKLLFKYDFSGSSEWNLDWAYSDEGRQYFQNLINKTKGVCYVCSDGTKIVGYLAGSLLPKPSFRPILRAELENMYVEEKYRGQGIGAKLVDLFMMWAKENNMQRILVEHFADNTNASIFYKRTGFVPYSNHLELDLRDY